jgi:hypothetical protein
MRGGDGESGDFREGNVSRFTRRGNGDLWLENTFKKSRDISPPRIGARDAMHRPGFPFDQRNQGGRREANREFS